MLAHDRSQSWNSQNRGEAHLAKGGVGRRQPVVDGVAQLGGRLRRQAVEYHLHSQGDGPCAQGVPSPRRGVLVLGGGRCAAHGRCRARRRSLASERGSTREGGAWWARRGVAGSDAHFPEMSLATRRAL